MKSIDSMDPQTYAAWRKEKRNVQRKGKPMTGIRIKSMVISAAFIVALFLPISSLLAKDQPDKIAAKVDDRTIEMKDFEREIEIYKMRYKGAQGELPPALEKQLRTQAINNLINREVLLLESDKKGIKVDKAEVAEGIKSIQKRFPSQKEFDEALKNMQLTLAELEQQYLQKATIQALLDQEIISKIKIKDGEARAYFDSHTEEFKQKEQVRARHILVKVDKGADEKTKAEARKKLVDVKKKIVAGEDFAELAKKHSEGPSNVKGGDLGYFARGQMVKAFEDVAFKLESNEVSDLVETRFGYHIIKVLDHKPEKLAEFADKKDKVLAKLRNERIQKQVGDYIKQLRQDAKIENMIK